MMHDRLHAILNRLFEEHRIVFWYDSMRDMRDAYDGYMQDGVEKIELANNEFGLKIRMLLEEPKQRFLVFKDGPEPPKTENWLLDVQLASSVFKADKVAILLAELGLSTQFESVVRDHMEFYRAATRVEKLRSLIDANHTETEILRCMLSVCAGVEGGLDSVIEVLLGQLAENRHDALKLIERCGLAEFFWAEACQTYDYQTDEPDFEDFAITLFQSGYYRAVDGDGKLNSKAELLFSGWKRNRDAHDSFSKLSKHCQQVLNIHQDLMQRDFRTLMPADHFIEIDRHIIRSVTHAMSAGTARPEEVLDWIRVRRDSHWYDTYKDIYQAISFAAEFQQALTSADLRMGSLEEGIERYISSWYRLDQLYRKFIYHYTQSTEVEFIAELFNTIEKLYINSFVLVINDAWQDHVTTLERWEIPGYPLQSNFYQRHAADYRRRDQKVAVIVSDALRYEIAEELMSEIRKVDRFDAELSVMIGVLPSYTQLGMAALLPHKSLAFKGDSARVLSDGEETSGIEMRGKLLAKGRDGDRCKAILFDNMMSLSPSKRREFFRDHDIVYVYHNHIDAIADKPLTEGHLPEVAEKTIEDLTRLARKLASANFSNILITADHGFLYQHSQLEESSFLTEEPQGAEIIHKSRRFVIGRGLTKTHGMTKFTAEQLGLSCDMDVLIANSAQRLRQQGSGSRFVHGGASLQEITVPVLRIDKRRESDIRYVDVQIIASGQSQITSGQIAVRFYQAEEVSEKVQPRELLAGIYAQDGTLISDEHPLMFDFKSANPRERETQVKFLMSGEADRYNNQNVALKLRERVGKTSHYTDYLSQSFTLRRGFGTDFEL